MQLEIEVRTIIIPGYADHIMILQIIHHSGKHLYFLKLQQFMREINFTPDWKILYSNTFQFRLGFILIVFITLERFGSFSQRSS